MSKTILVVDDEYDIVSALEMALSLEGYVVRTAFDGREAMDNLEGKPLPALIISDVMMPVWNGYDFIGALRARPEYRNIPVILASAAKLDLTRLKKGDWDDFIAKPFDLDHLMAKIEKVIARKLESQK